MLCLWGQNPKLITGHFEFAFWGVDPFFIATFATSLISASKGLASFLMDGPCKLVPKNRLFGGLGTMGFIFLCLNIIATLIGKGLMLAVSYSSLTRGPKVSIYNLEHMIILITILQNCVLGLYSGNILGLLQPTASINIGKF